AKEEFIVIADLDGGDQDARVFLAAPLGREQVESGEAGRLEETWTLEWMGWKPKARQEIRLGALIIKARGSGLPAQEVLQAQALDRLQQKGLADLPWDEKSRRFLARCRFVEKYSGMKNWPTFGEAGLAAGVREWLFLFGEWQGAAVWNSSSLLKGLEHCLSWKQRQQLDALAPEYFVLPSGGSKRLDYETNGVPTLSARMQEFFGCTTTPRICGQPLLLDLLSPAGRTVQRTRDLDGFWDRAYPEVKKELMGRYPRHSWPDNPRQAAARAGVRKKKRRD
ncbi:ATP-dependent helicase HrpB, partial [candidate division FCPU426 bacterium]|nr:ATP-dependent helicase HrpB [candidate division FCPU426 bacterium]